MEWYLKTFNELTNRELYEIYKVRVDVFVVEQNCPYPEVDEKDLTCFHYFLKSSKNEILAYCRIMNEKDAVKIGRIVVHQDYRKKGLGEELVSNALSIVEKSFQNNYIKIQAQEYVKTFYESFGFSAISDSYLEDGIPHLDMELYIEKKN